MQEKNNYKVKVYDKNEKTKYEVMCTTMRGAEKLYNELCGKDPNIPRPTLWKLTDDGWKGIMQKSKKFVTKKYLRASSDVPMSLS